LQLRFDFTAKGALTSEQLSAVEALCQQIIAAQVCCSAMQVCCSVLQCVAVGSVLRLSSVEALCQQITAAQM